MHAHIHTPTTCFYTWSEWSEAFMATIWNKLFSGDQSCNGGVQKLSVALHHCSLMWWQGIMMNGYKYSMWPQSLNTQTPHERGRDSLWNAGHTFPFTGWVLKTSLNLFLDGSSRHICTNMYFPLETNNGWECSSLYKQFVLNFNEFCSQWISFSIICSQNMKKGKGEERETKEGGKAKIISMISVILFYTVLVMVYDIWIQWL